MRPARCRRRSWRDVAGLLRPISVASFDGCRPMEVLPAHSASLETMSRRVGSARSSIPCPLRFGTPGMIAADAYRSLMANLLNHRFASIVPLERNYRDMGPDRRGANERAAWALRGDL